MIQTRIPNSAPGYINEVDIVLSEVVHHIINLEYAIPNNRIASVIQHIRSKIYILQVFGMCLLAPINHTV